MPEEIYKPVTKKQTKALESNGCSAGDWGLVQVCDGFDTAFVKNTHFSGKVRINDLSGTVTDAHGKKVTAGIYNAEIENCTVGKGCRIANVGVRIANYDIAENVCIENVGLIEANPGATFGNGVEVKVINEAGGREIVIFNELSAQFAYIAALHRHKPEVIEKLKTIARDYAESVRCDTGKIENDAKISSVKQIIDVNIGRSAVVEGTSSLINGSIISSADVPTVIGADVVAKDFIAAEGATVSGAANLEKVFVGQSCRIGMQFSAKNSLFFANCKAFGGEAYCVFAGPFTGSQHKSTLLIAGLFSFYNAGSGTNQSNHKYKLGAVHEGKLLRGSKTGSSSYMVWPCKVGPFTVVLGRHSVNFDTSEFPFSRIVPYGNNGTELVPAILLSSIGTMRDGCKWPNRDKRKNVKRDVINFDVFSPYTVSMMMTGHEVLKKLYEMTDETIENITFDNYIIKRSNLKKSMELYRMAIDIYILENIVNKVRIALEKNTDFDPAEIFASSDRAVFSAHWADIAGQLMTSGRLSDLHEAISSGEVDSVTTFAERIGSISANYEADLWIWVKNAYKQLFKKEVESLTAQDVIDLAGRLFELKTVFTEMLLKDAKREFCEDVHCGYGLDGTVQDIESDFRQVRGDIDSNDFVKMLNDDLARLKDNIEQIKQKL